MSPRATSGKDGRRRNRTSADTVTEYIRDQIFDGVLRSGGRIDRDLLAEETGTSAIPVREALIRLATEGTVTLERQRGAYVTPFTASDFEVESSMYGQIMTLAATRAIAERHDETVRALRDVLQAMDSEDDPIEFGFLLRDFYRVINLNGLPLRSRHFVRNFVRSIPERFFERQPDSLPLYRKLARRLFTAIEKGDTAGVASAVQDFNETHAQLVIESLRQSGAL